MKTTNKKESVKIHGIFRVKITEGNKVVGDSGWTKNQVTNLGIRDFLVDSVLGNSPTSVTHVALGSGGAPASNDTTLSGEVEKRTTPTTSVVASRTAQFLATFGSSDSFVTNTQNISNIGLFNSSSTGTMFSGQTYASSAVATNQNVNITYQIQIS